MITVIGIIVGIISGIAGGAFGFKCIAEKIMKRKIRTVLRNSIRELEKIEEAMDVDSLNVTLGKLARLANKLGYYE